MKKFLSANNWWFYFILTYLISWPIWALGHVLLPVNIMTITIIFGAFGPFISAMIILRVTVGGTGLKSWFKTTFNFRINFTLYLMGGIVFPFLIAAVHHIIYMILGGTSGVMFNLDWLIYFAYLIPTALLTGGNEEPGWRGYITPMSCSNIFQ